MNKVVLEQYPVSKLPKDMREGLPETGLARVTVEITPEDDSPLTSFFGFEGANTDVSENLAKLLKHRQEFPERYSHAGSMTEAVQRIRDLRDEWDDE